MQTVGQGTAINVQLYDANGNPVVLGVGPMSGYQRSDWDDQNQVKYYGFLDANGNWYIQKEDWQSGTVRFAKGSIGYVAAWVGRAALVYNYFDVVF